MAKTNPLQFMQQVRAETAKVVWPNRREVLLTTVMVFIMATLTAIFFFIRGLVHPYGAGRACWGSSAERTGRLLFCCGALEKVALDL
jgi:preprotein translocase subunit SecE